MTRPFKSPPVRLTFMFVAFLLAATLLYFSVRRVDWRLTWDLITQARLPLLMISIGVISASLFLRALRWRVLLSTEGPINVGPVFWATSAGYFCNNFLPARAGELVRTLMISSQSGMSVAFVLTTALAERIFDAMALVAISAVVLLSLPSPPGWLSQVAQPFTIIGICGLTTLILAPRFERIAQRLLTMLPGPPNLRIKLAEALARAVRGVRAFHSLEFLAKFGSLTAAIWFLDATATIASASALNLHFSYSIAYLLIAGLGLGSALPSTPGYIGVYQFVAVGVLAPFGFSRSAAIAYILLAQASSYVVIAGWGSLAFWRYRRLARRYRTLSGTKTPD